MIGVDIGEKGVAKMVLRALGAFVYGNKVYLLYRGEKTSPERFLLAQSDDGFNFEAIAAEGTISKGFQALDLTGARDFRFCRQDDQLIAVFNPGRGDKKLAIARLATLLEWEVQGEAGGITGIGMICPERLGGSRYTFWGGEEKIGVAYSDDLKTWQFEDKPAIAPRAEGFDSGPLTLQTAVKHQQGILVLYQSREGGNHYVGAAMLNKSDPSQLLWRAHDWVWKSIPEWTTENTDFIGAVEFDGRIISYWQVKGVGIYAVVYLIYEHNLSVQSKNISLYLEKSATNPLITPRVENAWEAFNTFNPAAIYEGGRVHILYRAQGYDYSSVVGYAASDDGVTITERLDKPCYIPRADFEVVGKSTTLSYDFMSGGGFGGCEDPRITKIDDRIYMTYIAFNGWSEPRIALTSISVVDFLNRRWLWEKPILISPPGVIDKSACLFPEKIRDKYVILHRVFPNILLDYVDDLNFNGTRWLTGEYQIKIRTDHWDSRKIGAGAPPIRTETGWLLIYYSVDERDDRRYKIGAMLLDLAYPEVVLHRTNNPILEPNEHYENEGFKAGVAYPCGAVVIEETLFVYYGGADTVVCVATANLKEFLAELIHTDLAKLEPAYIQPIR